MNDYVSTRPIGGNRDSAGTGFVIIPKGQDIKVFTDSCFRTGTISLLLENGGVIDNVLISRAALNDIEFPEKFDGMGSQVVWVNQPRKNQPIAIGSISKVDQFVNFNKNKSSLRRATKGFVSEVLVDAEKGCVIINSNSSSQSGGDIYIVSTNKNKTSQLKIVISSDINIQSQNFNIENSKKLSIVIKDKSIDDNITEVSYEKGIGFKYKDEFGNEVYLNDKNIQLIPNKILNIGTGKEPILLGDTFGQLLSDLIDLVSQATVTTVMGPMPLLNAVQIALLKKRIKSTKSKISFTD